MTMQAIVDPESTIFRKRRHKGMERWFVRVACNFFGTEGLWTIPGRAGS